MIATLRLWRYEVDEVWGFDDRDPKPVEVGTVLIDRWKSDRTWNVYNFVKDAEHVGGWHCKLLGEVTGDAYQEVMRQRVARVKP